MEGASFSTCGSRFCAAHNRIKMLQGFRKRWAGGFQNVAFAFAPRTFFSKNAKTVRIEGGSFSKVAIAVAPRTFV
eukprot:3490261-Pyramimonas_sp.AAC.1